MNKNEHKREKKEDIEKSPLDKFDNQKFADQIPLEDLKIETEQENKKRKSQSSSQSERKFKSDEK